MSTITRVIKPRQQPCYIDTRDDSKYKWISGALGWPADRLGALVVLGVAMFPDVLTRVYKMRVLDVEEQDNVTQLIKDGLRLREDCYAGEWYGDPRSPLMQFVHAENERLTMLSQPYFSLIEPHGFRDTSRPFMFYASAVKNGLQRGTLDLGNYIDLIEERLLELPEDKLDKVKVVSYPMISALGYVVASLQAYRPWEYGDRKVFERSLDLDDSRGFGHGGR